MIARSVKGSSARGLVEYLAGPGKVHEHEHPEVLVGSFDVELLLADVGHDLASKQVQITLARALSSPAKRFGRDGQKNLWHVPLSAPPGEHPTKDQWRQIGFSMVEKLGVSDGYRWAMVAHGMNRDGLAHAHLVIQRTHTETGKLASVAYDFKRVNAAAELTARELGLVELAEQQRFLPKAQQRENLPARELTGRAERIHVKITEALQRSDGSSPGLVEALKAQGILVKATRHDDRPGLAFAEADRPDVWLTGKQARWSQPLLAVAGRERRQEIHDAAQGLEQREANPALAPSRLQELRAANAAAADAYKQASQHVEEIEKTRKAAHAQARELDRAVLDTAEKLTAARNNLSQVDQGLVQQARELIERREKLAGFEREVQTFAAGRPDGMGRRDYKRQLASGRELLDQHRQAHARIEDKFARLAEWRPASPIYRCTDPHTIVKLAQQTAAKAATAKTLADTAKLKRDVAQGKLVTTIENQDRTARKASHAAWTEWVKASRALAAEEYRLNPTPEHQTEIQRLDELLNPKPQPQLEPPVARPAHHYSQDHGHGYER